ncbi:Multiple organellar RNA editing factor 2, chloroplastic [Vitis vinifera]|uniref:Multiple organellar RNA editing factor 2, chloroplastic n=1 Tax=Vitis vinifera TaxID=29760 RepID=A0A438GYK8_VITVI|nr:Multiple organellar RNA editing factor 2, chloroplastic [Vitis vinifera]RVW77288.1 Multiple organellar RNA editing factor 2, chloroplastic [Vitis vinifera]
MIGSIVQCSKCNTKVEVHFLFDCVAAELFVNGEIVQRSPERQRRVEPAPQRAQDRPRYNDKTRYVRRRENMR